MEDKATQTSINFNKAAVQSAQYGMTPLNFHQYLMHPKMKKTEMTFYLLLFLYISYHCLLWININFSTCHQLQDAKPHKHTGPCNHGDY